MSEHPPVTEEMVEAAMRSYYGYQSSREPENAKIRAAWLKALEAAQAVAPLKEREQETRDVGEAISALWTRIEARFWKGHEEGCAGRWDGEGEFDGCNCAHDSAASALEELAELAAASSPAAPPQDEADEAFYYDATKAAEWVNSFFLLRLDAESLETLRDALYAFSKNAAPSSPAAPPNETTPTIEAQRDRAAVRLIRKSFEEGIKHAGKNANVHCGDVIHLLDEFANGAFDNKLDEAHDSVTGPHFPEGVS